MHNIQEILEIFFPNHCALERVTLLRFDFTLNHKKCNDIVVVQCGGGGA